MELSNIVVAVLSVLLLVGAMVFYVLLRREHAGNLRQKMREEGRVRVMDGDLPKGEWIYGKGFLEIPHLARATRIDLSKLLITAEPLSLERKKKLAQTAGLGVAGWLALGPLGAIGGLVLGGIRTEIFFSANLADGRAFIGVTDPRTWALVRAHLSNHHNRSLTSAQTNPAGALQADSTQERREDQ